MTISKPNSATSPPWAPSTLLAYINGDLVPAQDATVSVFDSGLNFADGVFEGIRVYAGRVFRLEQHVKRLYDSARAFHIDIEMSQAQFTGEILRWLQANRVTDDFHFRPIVTRGNRFPPRLDPRFCQGETTIIFVGGPIKSTAATGLRVAISSVRQVNADALAPSIKSLNYGNNLLARLDALRRGVDDTIMLDSAGFVAEASASNIFIVQDGRLITPWTTACLAGITRQTILDLAATQGMPAQERNLTTAEVSNADEVFFTGTGSEIAPVVEVEGNVIGSGNTGPITQRLRECYSSLVRTEGTAITSR